MRDDSPAVLPPHRRPDRRRRLSHTADAGDFGAALQLEVARVVEGETAGEVAVGAERLHVEYVRGRRRGFEVRIHQCEKDVCSRVVLADRLATGRVPVGRVPAPRRPVPQGVKGMEPLHGVAARRRALDVGDRVDLVGVRGARIRMDGIFDRGVCQPDRIGPVSEQVHGGGAAELEVLGRELHVDARGGLTQQNRQLEKVRLLGAGRPIESGQVHEEELVRKGEVLLEQPVANEGFRRILEETLVPVEPDRSDLLRPEYDGRGLGAPADLKAHRVAQEHLVEGLQRPPLIVEEEAQRVDG